MRITLFLIIFLTAKLLQSQGFSMQAKKIHFKVGEEIQVNFSLANFEDEPLDLKKNRIEKIKLQHQGENLEEKNLVLDGNGKLKCFFTQEGTYLITAQSNELTIESDALKFNNYLKEEGLDNILEIRTKTNSLHKPSREILISYSKFLVQAGIHRDDSYKMKAGQRLEIIPQKNPYELQSGNYLQCLILFDSKPLANQLVKIWSKIGNTSFLQNAYTEKDGMVKFPISSKGLWMVTTTKMIVAEKPGADWQSYFGSLTFGIE